jgi:pyruvate formate lyase activating enzyme
MQVRPSTREKQIAKWWEVLAGNRVRCTLCPRYCNIPLGSHGFCYIRQNRGGILYSTAYGKSTGFAADPIEKKPLFHFFPGSKILSFGTIGCNLGCKYCQNWEVSKVQDEKYINAFYSPDEIISLAMANDCIGIAYTYNDPIIFSEWIIDISSKARKRGLKNVLVTNGYITPEARKDLFRFIDAVNVDLKSFSDVFYRKLTLSRLEPVLDTLRWLVHDSNIWIEITNLLIPGENDSNTEIERLTKFIAEELSKTIPLHFSAFHPDYKMLDTPTTPVSTLKNSYSIARNNGLLYVYTGNIPVFDYKCTYCPNCRKSIIERKYYLVTDQHLKGDKCGNCGYSIPGVFNNNIPAGK